MENLRIVALIGLPIVIFVLKLPLWWLLLLPVVFLRFTLVQEGTAKIVVRFKGFQKCVMRWKGYKLDKQWNVVKGEKIEIGGLRFVGFWPIDTNYRYKFRWQGIEMAEGREKIEFHERVIDYILVKPDVYWTKIEAAETTPPERIPIDIEWLITAKVINPYKALFEAPPNWLENILSRLNALFRAWTALKTIDEILELKKEPQKLWNEFKDDPLIKFFKEEWGIEILEGGIQIRDVNIPKEYARAAARQREMELEARGIAAETVGTVISMLAMARRRSDESIEKAEERIRKEIEKDPKLKEEFLKMAGDAMIRMMGIRGKSYVDIRVMGAQGTERMILNALAAWKRMPEKGMEEQEKPQKNNSPLFGEGRHY